MLLANVHCVGSIVSVTIVSGAVYKFDLIPHGKHPDWIG